LDHLLFFVRGNGNYSPATQPNSHVFGQTGKKEFSLDNVKITNQAWDTNIAAASGVCLLGSARSVRLFSHPFAQEYLSINWASSGGGAFAILPLPTPWGPVPRNLPYKLPDIIPLARGSFY
jgi:coronin-1B/1C/6